MNKKILIIVSAVVGIIILIVLSIILLLPILKPSPKETPVNNKNKEVKETGHFYGKPKSVSDITHVELKYNNGKDYIAISNENYIGYYTFDDTGKRIYKQVDKDTSKIYEKIFNNYLDDLTKEYPEKDAIWSIEVSSPGASCAIGGKDSQPSWFDELLKDVEAEENGYLYK